MPRGHNLTTCRLCGKEYICGDCITDGCELGHNRKSCEHYKAYLRKEAAAATQLTKLFHDKNGKAAAGARLLADLHWDNVMKEMSDAELADAILKEVWANHEVGSRTGAILAETIERLRGKHPNRPSSGTA